MMPQTLEGWTLEAIIELLDLGYFETEWFDFKEMLPHPKNDGDKLRLKKSCAAFANSGGGFLVFGIRDDRTLPSADRVVGLPAELDFPERFGNYPRGCTPSVEWSFKNPALTTAKGTLVHVVWIAPGWQAPHAVEVEKDGPMVFPKRTNKGNEKMDVYEVRRSFLRHHEKLVQLRLLKLELERISEAAGELVYDEDDRASKFSAQTFSLTLLERVLAECFYVLSDDKELVAELYQLRQFCLIANNKQRVFFVEAAIPKNTLEARTKKHNDAMAILAAQIATVAKSARQRVSAILPDSPTPE